MTKPATKPKPLTKNQVLQDLYAQLVGDDNSVLWEYFSSLIVKHVLIACSETERAQCAEYLKNDDTDQLDEFIETKLPQVINDIKKDIHAFKEKINHRLEQND